MTDTKEEQSRKIESVRTSTRSQTIVIAPYPYPAHLRRIMGLFRASLENPVSPYVLGECRLIALHVVEVAPGLPLDADSEILDRPGKQVYHIPSTVACFIM